MATEQQSDERPLVTHLDELLATPGGHPCGEFLRVPALSVSLSASGGHENNQQPHEQHEVHVVLVG